jgi:hypothetical protein
LGGGNYMTTQDLYTVADVKRVRELLTKEQDNCCAITGLEIPPKQKQEKEKKK